MRLIPSKLDFSVLDLMVIQSHWYVDIFPLHINTSSVAIGSSVLFLHSNFGKVRNMKITRIFPNTNLLKYIIPPQHAPSSIVVGHNMNHVSIKFTNIFKETSVSMIIIGKNGVFQLMGSPSKTQQLILMLCHIIQKRYS